MVVGCGNSRQDRGEVVSVVVVGCGNSRQDRGEVVSVVVGRTGVRLCQWWWWGVKIVGRTGVWL